MIPNGAHKCFSELGYNIYMEKPSKVFTEIGFGNPTFLSTEFEQGDKEYRVPRFILPGKIKSVYFRLWLFKSVFILDSQDGFFRQEKDKNKFKILFGVKGEGQ